MYNPEAEGDIDILKDDDVVELTDGTVEGVVTADIVPRRFDAEADGDGEVEVDGTEESDGAGVSDTIEVGEPRLETLGLLDEEKV